MRYCNSEVLYFSTCYYYYRCYLIVIGSSLRWDCMTPGEQARCQPAHTWAGYQCTPARTSPALPHSPPPPAPPPYAEVESANRALQAEADGAHKDMQEITALVDKHTKLEAAYKELQVQGKGGGVMTEEAVSDSHSPAARAAPDLPLHYVYKSE